MITATPTHEYAEAEDLEWTGAEPGGTDGEDADYAEAPAFVLSPRATQSLAEALRALRLPDVPHVPAPCPLHAHPPVLAALRGDVARVLFGEGAAQERLARVAMRVYLRIAAQCAAQCVCRQWVLPVLTREAFLDDLRMYFVFDTPLFSVAFAKDAMHRRRAWPLAADSEFFRLD